MYTLRRQILCWALLAVAASAWSGAALADGADERKTVGGIEFYIGILPSEMVLGHPKVHTESTMHDGPSGRSGQYHLVLALFKAATGERISDAQVTARVTPLGTAGQEKELQPMAIGEAPSYGNFFNMPGKGPFRIVIDVRRPGVTGKVEATFEHRH